MRNIVRIVLLCALALGLAACSTTKYVPEGSYLLDDVHIRTDNKDVRPSQLQVVQPDKDAALCLQLVGARLDEMDQPRASADGRCPCHL